MIKSLDELVPQAKVNKPHSKPARPTAQESSLAECVLQVGKDLFTPGRQGEKNRIRSAYQLRQKLGVHQAVEAQAESQDLISKTGRGLNTANRVVSGGIQTARRHLKEEARTATGVYRAAVGLGQGFTELADLGFQGTKAVAKLGAGASELGYYALKGEVDLKDLARKGGRAALILAEKGIHYTVSGQMVTDAKKFSKDFKEYGARVVNDPLLELPKASVLVGGAILAAGPERIAAGARGATSLLSKLATRGAAAESAAAVAETEAVLAAETAATATAPAAATEAAGTVGGVTPKGWVPRNATAAAKDAASTLAEVTPKGWVPRGAAPRPFTPTPTPAPAAPPVNQELLRNLQQALKLSQQSAPKAPMAPSPIQLPPGNLPLPVKTPVCLPSSNYAPVAPKGYLQILEPMEGGLNIVG